MEEHFIVCTDDGKQDSYLDPSTIEFELGMSDKFLFVERVKGDRRELLAMYYADKINCIVRRKS